MQSNLAITIERTSKNTIPELSPMKKDVIKPRNKTEATIAAIWKRLLSLPEVGMTEDFFYLGGDSLLAVQLSCEIESSFNVIVPASLILENSTIEKLALFIVEERTATNSSIVPLRIRADKRPLYCVHNIGGEALSFKPLSDAISDDFSVYGIAFHKTFTEIKLTGRFDFNVQQLAEHYVKEIIAFQPRGPYYLLGHSFGGFIVHEMACLLIAQNREVALCGILDTRNRSYEKKIPWWHCLKVCLQDIWRTPAADSAGWIFLQGRYGQWVPLPEIPGYLKQEFCRIVKCILHGGKIRERQIMLRQQWKEAGSVSQRSTGPSPMEQYLTLMREEHVPTFYPGRIVVFRATECLSVDRGYYYRQQDKLGWADAALQVDMVDTPGDHGSLLREPFVKDLAERLNGILQSNDLPN